jgi:hypothetical protein
MMAIYSGTILLATHDEWGAIENSLTNSNLPHQNPPDGWKTTFEVDGKKYSGRGWHVPLETARFVKNHRGLVDASAFDI